MPQITKDDVVQTTVDVLCAPEPGQLTMGVKAYTLKDVPGLAVIRSIDSGKQIAKSWHITHVKSGRKIFTPWPTALQALIVMRALGAAVSQWDRTREELQATPGLKAKTEAVFKSFTQIEDEL